IGTVAVQAEDRLFRDEHQVDSNMFVQACREHRVQVIVGNMRYVFHDPIHGTYQREMFRQKSKAAADYIADIIKGKLATARARLDAEGKWNGRRIPRGYMVDMRPDENNVVRGKPQPRRTFVEFEPFAAVVREIFETFVESGGNAYEAARSL